MNEGMIEWLNEWLYDILNKILPNLFKILSSMNA